VAEALAAAMKELILEPAVRRELGHRARDRVATQYSIERCISRTEDLYEELLFE
jgi:glycosyltransferase involved in cell wall biosynthesis